MKYFNFNLIIGIVFAFFFSGISASASPVIIDEDVTSYSEFYSPSVAPLSDDIYLDSGEVTMPTYEATSSPEFDTDVVTPIYQGGKPNTSSFGGMWYIIPSLPEQDALYHRTHLFQFSTKYVFDLELLDNYVYLATFDDIEKPTKIYTVVFDTESIQQTVYARRFISQDGTFLPYQEQNHPYININNPTALNKIKTLGIASQGGNVDAIWYISSNNWCVPRFEDYKTSKVLWFKTEQDLVAYAETQDKNLIINKLDTPWYDDSLINDRIPNPKLSYKDKVIHLDNYSDEYIVEYRGRYRYINNVNVTLDSNNRPCVNYTDVESTHWFFHSYKEAFYGEHIRLVNDVFDLYSPRNLFLSTDMDDDGIRVFGSYNPDGSKISSTFTAANKIKSILSDNAGDGCYKVPVFKNGVLNLTGRCITPDLYIRYVKKNGDSIEYSPWTHFTLNLTPSGNDKDDLVNDDQYFVNNSSGLTSSEVLDQYEDTIYKGDDTLELVVPEKDTPIINPSSSGFLSGLSDVASLITNASTVLKSSISYVGNVPSIINTVFGFLPVWLRNLLYSSISFTCIIGMIKVLRG